MSTMTRCLNASRQFGGNEARHKIHSAARRIVHHNVTTRVGNSVALTPRTAARR